MPDGVVHAKEQIPGKQTGFMAWGVRLDLKNPHGESRLVLTRNGDGLSVWVHAEADVTDAVAQVFIHHEFSQHPLGTQALLGIPSSPRLLIECLCRLIRMLTGPSQQVILRLLALGKFFRFQALHDGRG